MPPETPEKNLSRWRTALAYRGGWLLARTLLASFTRLRITGAEHIPQRSAFLLAANHISHFDPPFVGIAARRTLDWMATAEFFSHGLLGPFMRAVGAFSVDRSGRGDLKAVREASRRLRRGRPVGMFPEGGIRAGATSVLEGATPRAGVSRLAVIARSPVVPCVILGSDRLYDKHRWRPWPWRRRTPIWVSFGPAILPDEWERGSPDLFGERMRALYAQMQGEFRLLPDDLPTTPQRRKGQF